MIGLTVPDELKMQLPYNFSRVRSTSGQFYP